VGLPGLLPLTGKVHKKEGLSMTAKRKESKRLLNTPKKEDSTGVSSLEVIVDFIHDDGLFYVAIENLSGRPALKVRVRFDAKIFGVGGLDVSTLALFRNIEFLAPRKRIVTFLDTATAYFGRGEPTKISLEVSYLDPDGLWHNGTILHDLEIYRDIGFVRKQQSSFIQNSAALFERR
jgi:hypothetical protein